MSSHPSVQTASRILDTEDIDFQQIGWWFNRDYKLALVPNSEGRVAVPASALDIQISNVAMKSPEEKVRFARRGNFIYDTIKHTDVLSTTLHVDVVTQLPINNLPSLAASYLLHKAREAMYLDDDGDSFKLNELKDKSLMAWSKLKAKELQMLAVNALDNPTARLLNAGGNSGSRNPNLIGGRVR
jgi:hypothetical protein